MRNSPRMTPTSELFELIHSLSGVEKSYFKKFASLHVKGAKNNYVKLFDVIVKQKEYNEEGIKESLSDQSFSKRLASEKIYLQNLILKSLRLFHSQHSIDFILRQKIEYAYLYAGKGLYSQAAKVLAKAKIQAQKHELFLLLADIIIAENKFLSLSGDPHNKIKTEENSLLLLSSINSEFTIQQIHLKEKELINFYVRAKGNARDLKTLKEAEQIINDPIFSEENSAIPNRGKMLVHNAKAGYYYFIGDYEKAYIHNKKYHETSVIELSQSGDKQNYIISLYNLFTICFLNRKSEECNTILEKLKKIQLSGPSQNEGTFARLLSMEMSLCVAKGDFKKGLPLALKADKLQKELKNKINKASYYNIVYFVAYIYFGSKRYSESLKWLNKIINDKEADKIEYIYCASYILAVIAHMEHAKNETFEFILKPFYKYLYKRNRLYKFEALLLLFIKKEIPKIHNSKQLIFSYQKLYDNLLKLQKDSFESTAFQYFDIIAWLESKINGKTFEEIKSKNHFAN
jgi:hypothetical protein